jgi:lysozyme
MAMGLTSLLSSIFAAFRKPSMSQDQAAPAPVAPAALTPAPAVEPQWLILVRPLAKLSEGLRLQAYQDIGGVWTIGYGHTGGDVYPGLIWTEAQADAQLDADLYSFGDMLDEAVQISLLPQEKAALVDLLFNVGPGRVGARSGSLVLASGQPSTILRMVNASDIDGAAAQFMAWDKAGGLVVGGLETRRARERSLFLTGAWQ